jgi:sulfur carrier protein
MGEILMISIRFNEEVLQLEEMSLSALLTARGYVEAYAVSLNRQFLPKAQHAEIRLKENDLVEIIQPMQGG